MGIKKALVIGINYSSDADARLRGCQNDALRARDYLVDVRGYAKKDVTVALDRKGGNDEGTTKGGIVEGILRLANATYREEVEEVYIHYSGHGAQMEDYRIGTGIREEGGLDEALVPSDFRTHGLLRDDKINSLFQEFHPRTRVRCVFDCCHSGTMGDLPWKYTANAEKVREVKTGTATPGDVMCLSGCRDDQVSMDAYDVNGRKKYAGAMTACMLKVVEAQRGGGGADPPSLRTLFTELHATLKAHGFRQKPVLTASTAVDLDVCRF